MSIFTILIAMMLSGLVFCIGYIVLSVEALFNHRVKRAFFLFRWFLVGRYHCDFTNSKITKSQYKLLNRLTWYSIILSLVLATAAIVEAITPN